MLQRFFSDPKFFLFLLSIDEDLAEKARLACCLLCKGRLHWANYPRKPRGGPCDLDDQHKCRFSLCCYKCRKRLTPSSMRFLGRKVYLGAIVVLISAMLGGVSPRRRRRLREHCGADERTLVRWRTWWAEVFPQTSVGKDLTARVALCGLPDALIPRRLLRGMKKMPLAQALSGVLQLLLPLTGGRGAG